MGTEEDTFKKLRRTPYAEIADIEFELWISCALKDEEAFFAERSRILLQHGWTEEDFDSAVRMDQDTLTL